MSKFRTSLICLLISSQIANGQGISKKHPTNRPDKEYTMLFYNTENLFDIFDDPDKGDNDFLPGSKRNWNKERYFNKIDNLSKTILATGIEPPIVAGFAEVENLQVLNDLTRKTPLSKFNYKIIHHDSPDPRGIDVAVIYRPDVYRPIKTGFICIKSTKEDELQTREILYSKGTVNNSDTIHVFINHWPSRRGGLRKSEPKRFIVANTLRLKLDSIIKTDANAKIIIMGDFNDEPDNTSITKKLQAKVHPEEVFDNQLLNLSAGWLKDISWKGTYKYNGHWSVFDQIIVSNALIRAKRNNLYSTEKSAEIYSPDFLLQEDVKYSGKTPFKTYNGMKYLGGFSDHLPVLLRLSSK